ncbi:MAG: hypothetical protein ETSY1_23470 [Candidatus Entotheonella factor]|uniref:Uncharacterized protein n=1 Tax=Entotheonella factor TaxID=1429438 RepID=W4LHN2_ENTF1|nr:MAG: hypothetical protein ETSY1_23470 [Candidatus Entotheonella factor]
MKKIQKCKILKRVGIILIGMSLLPFLSQYSYCLINYVGNLKGILGCVFLALWPTFGNPVFKTITIFSFVSGVLFLLASFIVNRRKNKSPPPPEL